MDVKRRVAHFYKTPNGIEPAREWLEHLKDRTAQAKVTTRIARAEQGNFGDYKAVGDGVLELRIPFGPGFRVYFALDENDEIILLLFGGDKSTREKDILKAKEFWNEHRESSYGKR